MRHGGNVWSGDAPERWLDFSANLRPEGPPEWVIEAMRRALDKMRFYPDLSMADAKKGLSEYAGVPYENILPTAGGAAAIDLALSLDRGRVLVNRPTFGEYEERARAHGRETADVNETAYGTGDTIVICNPNNPTGSVMTRDEVLLAKERSAAAGTRLVVDEAFIDYCPEHSVRSLADDDMIVVGSLTKILCVPGVRLGYVCASPRVIDRLEKLALPWQLNAAATEIAKELPKHLDELSGYAEINRRRREEMAGMLRSMGVKVMPSGAAFLLCDFGTDMAAAAEELKTKGILVRTCSSFGLGDNWLRLAVKREDENRVLIGELKKCLIR